MNLFPTVLSSISSTLANSAAELAPTDGQTRSALAPHRFPKSRRLNILLGVLALGAIAAPPRALAQTNVEFVAPPPPPPEQGAPTGRRQGGATRGHCSDYQGLTALVPQVDGVVWSQTASALPPFFFYIPAALNSDIPIEFVIQDRDDHYAVYQGFTVEANAGILAVPITAETSGLDLGQTYTWTFSVYCDKDRPSASISVSGSVQRVTEPVEIITEPAAAPAVQLAQIQQYAAAGIWHEAIALALQLHKSNPTNVEFLEALEALLEQSGLTEISPTEPVFECCQAEAPQR